EVGAGVEGEQRAIDRTVEGAEKLTDLSSKEGASTELVERAEKEAAGAEGRYAPVRRSLDSWVSRAYAPELLPIPTGIGGGLGMRQNPNLNLNTFTNIRVSPGQGTRLGLGLGSGQASMVKLGLDLGTGTISSLRGMSDMSDLTTPFTSLSVESIPFTSLSTESLPSTSLSTESSTTTTTVVVPLPTDITGVSLLEPQIPMLYTGGKRQRVGVGTPPIVGIGRAAPLVQVGKGAGFGYSLKHAPIAIDAIAALNRALGGGRRGGGGARRQRRT
ncbi:MAG: hypothetical protein ACP5UD_09050, partial [Conexivisphaera sp.]